MSRTLPSLLLALTLSATALTAPPALAEEAAADPSAGTAAPAAVLPSELVAPDVPECVAAPTDGVEDPALGDPSEPLFLGVPCNERRCGPKEFCCNFSCSICASIFGGACTQQVCPIRP